MLMKKEENHMDHTIVQTNKCNECRDRKIAFARIETLIDCLQRHNRKTINTGTTKAVSTGFIYISMNN